MLVRCLYASRHKGALDNGSLERIVEQARRNNPALGVTGLLCVAETLFVQVLEGGRDEVCELFNAIVADPRHEHVRLLIYEEIEQRLFRNWTMGLFLTDRLNAMLLLKYFKRAQLDPFECSGRVTLAFMTELVDSATINQRGD